MAEKLDIEMPKDDDNESFPLNEQLEQIHQSLGRISNVLGYHLEISIHSIMLFINDFSRKLDSIYENINPAIDRLKRIASSIKSFSRLMASIDKLCGVQYVCWDYLDEDFISGLLQSNNTNKYLRLRFEKEKYKSVYDTIEKCKKSDLVPNKRLLEQVEFSFVNGKNEIAILGLIALIDDALTLVSGDASTSIRNRVEPIIEQLNDNDSIESDEYAIIIFLFTFESTVKSFDRFVDFSLPEGKELNRHMIVHGRAHRRKTKLDCVKLINILYGIILLDELANTNNIEVENV